MPCVEDLEMAEKCDGVVVAHIGDNMDADVAEKKRDAVLTLIGLPKDHPLLTRLFVLDGPYDKIAEFVQQYDWMEELWYDR